MKQRRAFTLLELLMVIGVVVLLVGLVFVAFRNVRAGAVRADSQGALRQLIGAYSLYSADDKMRLMPGYLDQTGLEDVGTRVLSEDGFLLFDPGNPSANCGADGCDAGSYVWRLGPYLDYDWQTYLVDYQSDSIQASIQGELKKDADPANNTYGPGSRTGSELGLSGVPAFGLNSIYVGGDTTHGGEAAQYHPWQTVNDTIAATRVSEVRNPSKLIVFAPAARADETMGSDSPYIENATYGVMIGYPELRPPAIVLDGTELPQWSIGAGAELVRDPMANLDPAGLPIARWDKEVIPVANLDGSCSMDNMSNLSKDLSRWQPFD